MSKMFTVLMMELLKIIDVRSLCPSDKMMCIETLIINIKNYSILKIIVKKECCCIAV